MRPRPALVGSLLLLLLLAPAAQATTWTVCPSGGADFTNLAAAIAGATDGDILDLCTGFFTGANNANLNPNGKILTIRGSGLLTFINPSGAGRAFVFDSGETGAFLVEDLSIVSGDATPVGAAGGAVYIDGASPTFHNVSFRLNSTATIWGGQGGAVYVNSGSPSFVDCYFGENSSFDDGGAISAYSPIVLDGCTFEWNQCTQANGGALSFLFATGTTIENCRFLENSALGYGGAISCNSFTAMPDECTFSGNTAGSDGGAVEVGNQAVITLSRCTLDGNGAPNGGGAHVYTTGNLTLVNTIITGSSQGGAVACDTGAVFSMSCSDLFGNFGGDYVGCAASFAGINDNISADPIYCGTASATSPWTLRSDSPCAAAQQPVCGRIGAWDVDCSPPPVHKLVWAQDLVGVIYGDAQWGDLDGDGDLDLVYCGQSNGSALTRTYENQGGTLVHRPQANLKGVWSTGSDALAWGDLDNDGDLDLVVTGTDGTDRVALFYRNHGGGTLMAEPSQGLTGVSGSSAAWGDVDADGDLDLYVQGHDGTNPIATLYRNDPIGHLTPDPSFAPVGLSGGSADWVDDDGDGDLDLVVTGAVGAGDRRTIFYRNEPTGTLTNDGNHGLPGVALSDLAWGDYDNDGDMDVALSGEDASGTEQGEVYANDGTGVLAPTNVLPDYYRSALAWGDIDDDGDLDLALMGYDASWVYSHVYENDGGSFTQLFTLPEAREGCIAFADIDADLDLDLCFLGADFNGNEYAQIYENLNAPVHSVPGTPTGLAHRWLFDGVLGQILELSWDAPTDDRTPSAGLYYQLRVGRTPGGHEVFSGSYHTPLMGNVDQRRVMHIALGHGPDYYWSVRALDTAFAPSAWAAEQTVPPPAGADISWYFRDTGQVVWGQNGWNNPPKWEPMDWGPLTYVSHYHDLDPPNPYYACTEPLSSRFTGFDFYADIWLANNWPGSVNPVTVELWKGQWGAPTAMLATASANITNQMPSQKYTFSFGQAVGTLNAECLIVKIIYYGALGDGHIYWDGTVDAPSRLHAVVRTDVPGRPAVSSLVLEPNVPNPFNPSTELRYAVPDAADGEPVRLTIYDLTGRRVRVLVDEPQSAGPQKAFWNGVDAQGRSVASGVYLYVLEVAGERRARRMVLLK